MRAYLIILLILLTGTGAATVIEVGPAGTNYTSIGSAVGAAHPGDTIEVSSGTYFENVYVDKNVTLKGMDTGKGLPVIDAGGYGSVVTLEADGITLEGFNLTHSGHCGCGNAGVHVSSNNNSVIDNIIRNNKYGIYATQSRGNLFLLNDLIDNNITTYDDGKNSWDGNDQVNGLQSILESLSGKKIKGNYYSDYSGPKNGCNDTNADGFCDLSRDINGGSNVDSHPLAAPVHS